MAKIFEIYMSPEIFFIFIISNKIMTLNFKLIIYYWQYIDNKYWK
jgi:hypothetical protein